MAQSFTESELKRRYDDFVAARNGGDTMPRYDQLDEAMIALWRLIQELKDDDSGTDAEPGC